MPEIDKSRCCNVCKTDPDSFKANARTCDGCGKPTCRHVATSKGDDDRCRFCALKARKADKAKGEKKTDDGGDSKKADDSKKAAAS